MRMVSWASGGRREGMGGRGWRNGMGEEWDGVGVMGVEEGGGWGVGYTG